MKLISFSAVALAAAIISSSAANAAVIQSTALAPHVGEGGPAFSHVVGDLNIGDTYVFNGVTYTNTGSSNDGVQFKVAPNDGNGAQPFATSGNYLSVLGGGELTMKFAPTNTFGFYWGSIDTYNSIEFWNGGTLVDTLTGGDAALQASLLANGNQFDYNSNRYINFFDPAGTFDRLVLTSGQNSFEFTNVNAVPEPATWAMMILGFLAIGFLGYRKGSTSFRLA